MVLAAAKGGDTKQVALDPEEIEMDALERMVGPSQKSPMLVLVLATS